jgi:hypothetical protein
MRRGVLTSWVPCYPGSMGSQVAEVVELGVADEGKGEGEGVTHVVLVTFGDDEIALVVRAHVHECDDPFRKAIPWSRRERDA